MTLTIHLLLVILFFVCELAAALGVVTRINLQALGLAFFALSLLF